MITVKSFIFNSFQVNCYLLYDETKACVIVDPSCYEKSEAEYLAAFIEKENLNPVHIINTHAHIDHILGNPHIFRLYGLRPWYHSGSAPFILTAQEVAASFAYTLRDMPEPAGHLTDGDRISFGNSHLQVLHTPGHADGHICLYNDKQGFVLTGDVIFRDTIGRTDLPTGNFDLLMQSIRSKLFVLPDDTVVYPGHGPDTTIGYEKRNNPFIR